MIPALNEAASLRFVLEGLPPVDEVILVDGGSADDTIAVAREVRPGVHVVRQTRRGKGNALVCGFAASTGDIVVTLNADGSTDPGELPRYVDALLAGAEVAHGSRYREGGGDLAGRRLDRLGNAALSRIVDLLFGTRFTDLCSGYNAYWRTVLPSLHLPGTEVPGLKRGRQVWGDGSEIDPLVNIRMAAQGLRVVEVASIGYPRTHGRDRRRLRRAVRALRVTFGEYLRGRGAGQRSAGPAAPRLDLTTMFRHADTTGTQSETPLSEYAGPAGPATTERESTGARHHASRLSWSETTGGSLYDTLTGVGYQSVERHETTGGIRHHTSSLPPGRRPAGETSIGRHAIPADPAIGVRHSQVYDTGARHRAEGVPDEGVNPLLRPAPPREVGGGRRRLESHDRRPDGRPDLTVIPGEGFDEGWHRSDTSSPGRPNHLRAVPGSRRRGSTSSL